MTSTKVQTCGKLYIAGEYAVLTPGQTAVIKNIPIYMTAEISPHTEIKLYSDLFDYSVTMQANADYALIQASVQTMADYLQLAVSDLSPFFLEIRGKMERQGKKLGIGSSGSVTVLVLKALAAFYEISLSQDMLFRLAAATLLRLGDNGSMGDIACIAYDNLISFKSFDRSVVARWLAASSLQVVLDKDWGYEIETIIPRIDCDFLVGWTGIPSISRDMIEQVKSAITPEFLADTEEAVQVCRKSLLSGDKSAVKKSLRQVSYLLESLSPAIYTQPLIALRDAQDGLDVVAKSSGSGGGDCGVALSFDEGSTQALIKRWEALGLTVLDVEELG